MPFIEQKAKAEYKDINGKRTLVITPECEVTLKNLETGQEYMSDEEADNDVNNPETATKREHISRSVKLTVESLPLGSDSNL
jgi:predicted GTPase|tara:strand:+ start:314 stop:559 length:246 start_codon:yes stop_codon:yes gene_type:complete